MQTGEEWPATLTNDPGEGEGPPCSAVPSDDQGGGKVGGGPREEEWAAA